ncbi:helix-turn-helix transcriptional regulator [Natronolimnobius sp. AArcel1]|uniref:ArsR/SmtB family transcription factor n=1 Tax=Natronolimnobius sp. AArcel1 TaxID=1679093 RepID=UPI0013EB1F77|nr:helix-turn-helix domain-containing protein [Natronolimnobius sp. AArcel1]NGM68049.1 helix-turn-helix transcriptional regulator [Natronolimnobius sp. AArcel1]
MARLFPFRSETPSQEGQPRVVDLEGEDADAVFSALSSTTARQIYARLDEDPGTPSDIADAIDSSIQNVRYHLENLEEAGLVEVVDTWYSSRGNEMSVYATTDGPLIVTSDESTASQLKAAISRLIGGVGALAGGSLLVQHGVTEWVDPAGTPAPDTEREAAANGDAAADDGETLSGASAESADEPDAEAADEPREDADDGFGTQTVDEEASEEEADDAATSDDAADESVDDLEDDAPADDTDDAEPTADGYDAAADDTALNATDVAEPDALATVPPGLLFFLGGLVVFLAVWLYWYWYRPAY